MDSDEFTAALVLSMLPDNILQTINCQALFHSFTIVCNRNNRSGINNSYNSVRCEASGRFITHCLNTVTLWCDKHEPKQLPKVYMLLCISLKHVNQLRK